MTFRIVTTSGKSEYIHDVISVRQVGKHTYEFTQHGKVGRLIAAGISIIQCDIRCLCHEAKD